MKPPSGFQALAVAACGFALLLPLAARAEPLSLSVAPFVWAPSLKGQLSEGPVTIPLDAGVGDLASGVRGGGMLHVEASSDRVRASLQAIYVDFHERGFAPVLGADVRSSLFTIEALAGPSLSAGPMTVAPLVGLRQTRIKCTFEAQGLGRLSAGRTWREGLVGLEVLAPLDRRFTLRARGTVAVAGPDGQASSDLILAGSYRLSRRVSLAGGYRWASEKLDRGRPAGFGMDLDAGGPVLGLVIGLGPSAP